MLVSYCAPARKFRRRAATSEQSNPLPFQFQFAPIFFSKQTHKYICLQQISRRETRAKAIKPTFAPPPGDRCNHPHFDVQ
jgi:hypothetical protein